MEMSEAVRRVSGQYRGKKSGIEVPVIEASLEARKNQNTSHHGK